MISVELSIIVVSYNTRALLARCLTSLAAAAHETGQEIIVVDNASGDGSAEMVRRDFPGVRCIANAANVGFARAVNQGIRVSRGEWLVLVNSDAEVFPGSLDALVAFLRAQPTVGAVGPQIRFPDGRVCQSCFRFPTLFRPYLNFEVVRRVAGDAFSLSYPPGAPPRAEGGEVDWLSGACLVLRRKALDQVGLLDEHFFMYFEDTDLCRRLHGAGWSVWYRPQIHVFHRVGQSGTGERERLHVEMRRSALHYFRVHHPGPVSWAVRALVFAAALWRLARGGAPVRAVERRIMRLALFGSGHADLVP